MSAAPLSHAQLALAAPEAAMEIACALLSSEKASEREQACALADACLASARGGSALSASALRLLVALLERAEPEKAASVAALFQAALEKNASRALPLLSAVSAARLGAALPGVFKRASPKCLSESPHAIRWALDNGAISEERFAQIAHELRPARGETQEPPEVWRLLCELYPERVSALFARWSDPATRPAPFFGDSLDAFFVGPGASLAANALALSPAAELPGLMERLSQAGRRLPSEATEFIAVFSEALHRRRAQDPLFAERADRALREDWAQEKANAVGRVYSTVTANPNTFIAKFEFKPSGWSDFPLASLISQGSLAGLGAPNRPPDPARQLRFLQAYIEGMAKGDPKALMTFSPGARLDRLAGFSPRPAYGHLGACVALLFAAPDMDLSCIERPADGKEEEAAQELAYFLSFCGRPPLDLALRFIERSALLRAAKKAKKTRSAPRPRL